MANALAAIHILGLKFKPGDVDMISILRRRINGIALPAVPDHNFDVDILIPFNYSIDPQALFLERGYDVAERGFFFCTVDDVNAGGGGGWVLKQADGVKTIPDLHNQTIGIKETRLFQNTDWVLELFSTHPDHHQVHLMKMYRRSTLTPSPSTATGSDVIDELFDELLLDQEYNIGQADDAELVNAESGGLPNDGLDDGGVDVGGGANIAAAANGADGIIRALKE